MLFGGIGGLDVVQPNRLTHWTFQPQIAITDIRMAARPGKRGGSPAAVCPDPLKVTPTPTASPWKFSAVGLLGSRAQPVMHIGSMARSAWVDTKLRTGSPLIRIFRLGDYTIHLRGSNAMVSGPETVLGCRSAFCLRGIRLALFRAALSLPRSLSGGAGAGTHDVSAPQSA